MNTSLLPVIAFLGLVVIGVSAAFVELWHRHLLGLQKIKEEGALAYQVGKPFIENPYHLLTEERKAWASGWISEMTLSVHKQAVSNQ